MPEVNENSDNRLEKFTWKAIHPGQVTVYFEIERASPHPSRASIEPPVGPIRADLRTAFVQIRIGHSATYFYLSLICGWVYFICWMLGLYPQLIVNFVRRSCDGLNIDYVGTFNTRLYLSPLANFSDK